MSNEQSTLTLEMLLNMQGVVEALEELVTKGGDADDRMIALQDTIKEIADIAGVGFDEAGESVLRLSAALDKIDISVEQVATAVGNLDKESTKFQGIKTTNAVVETKKFRTAVNALKEELKSTALAAKTSFKDAAEGIRNSKVKGNAKEISTALREVETEAKALKSVTTTFRAMGTEMKKAETAVGGISAAFNKMGTVAKTVFGFTLANIATRALRAVTEYLKNAVKAGEDFVQSMFRMSVGVRALQASGMNVTISEFTDKIKELQETWGVFTTRELVGAIGYMTLLTREVGLTKDQMLDLLDASAALSVLLGKDMNETLRQVSLAISSGYAEALQRAGLNVNKVEIAHKALEMGINKTFMAMTGEERALVTLTLILEQTAKVTEDAAEWQKTLGGRIDVSKTKLRQNTDYIGKSFLPMYAGLIEILARAVEAFMNLINIGKVFMMAAVGAFVIPMRIIASTADMMYKSMSGKGEFTIGDVKEANRQIVNDYRATMAEIMSLQFPLGDFGADAAKSFIKAFTTEMSSFLIDPTVVEAFEELEEIIEDINEKIADETERFHESQLIRERKYAFKLEQLLIANAAAREKLIRKTNDRIEGENIKYQQNLADAHADYLQDQADAELDYRRRELDAEQDYQDELRKMRDQLLFDLEEAVRQRDASQIRRLLRQAEFRKNQLGVDHERESEENRERLERELADNRLKLKRELKDIRRAHEIRLREIKIDGQRQLAELIRTQKARMQAMAEQERLERELATEKHERELADIRAGGEEKVRAWTESFLEMYGITVDATDEIYKYLNSAFGPGGSIEGIFIYLTDMVTQMVLDFQKLTTSVKGLPKSEWKPKSEPNQWKPPVDATSWADGGTLIANKPTLAVFGDNGPERVDFTPIGRRGSDVGKVFGGALPSGSDAQKLALEILLSPDLEARITENTLGEFSDILVSVERTA